jgi:hypothetical protein
LTITLFFRHLTNRALFFKLLKYSGSFSDERDVWKKIVLAYPKGGYVMKALWIALTLVISLSLASCGLSEESSAKTPENPLQLSSTPESEEMPSNPPPVEKFVALSKKDLASCLGIEADKITLVKTAEMLWLNAALGCPRPGQFYASGRVPGFQIWLDVEGTEYVYNTDLNGKVILCPELNPHVPNSTTDPTPGVPIQ